MTFFYIISSCFLISLIPILLWLRQKKHAKRYTLPAGPPGLPIFGNFFSLRTVLPHLKFSEWAKTYGNMYTVNIFTKNVLVVSCPKLMRQIFDHPASAGKFDLEPVILLAGGPYGVTSTRGKIWMEQRKFCIRGLRQFGMGKRNAMQSKIVTEADQAVQVIRNQINENNGLVESPIDFLRTATNSILWNIIRGDKSPLESERVNKITEEFGEAFNTSVKTGLAIFPWLKWIAPKWSGYTGLVESTNKLHQFIREEIEEHKTNRQLEADGSKEEARDMIDVYIDQMETTNKTGNSSSTFYGENGWKNSIAIMAEMFAGGGESTPHTLNWLVLYLSHHQKVQRKLQEEIDQVVGRNQPCLQDKPRMKYTEAVLLETLRFSSVFPLTIAHELTEDADICDYKLPKGLLLLPNIYQAHMNKQFWGDPEVFRPERFISVSDADKNIISERKASVVAFGVGKRYCLGEPLAMDVIFLFVLKLFQAFTVLPFPENAKPDFESTDPFMMIANPYQIIVKERN